MKRSSPHFAVAVIALGARSEVLAEVVDKMPSVPEMWITNAVLAAVLGTLCYFAARRITLGVLILIAAIVYALPPSVVPEFLPEALNYFGANYPVHAQAAQILVPIAAAIALWCRWRRNAVQRQ